MKTANGKKLKWFLLGLTAAVMIIWILHMLFAEAHGVQNNIQSIRSFKQIEFGHHGFEGRGPMKEYAVLNGGQSNISGDEIAVLFFKIAFILFGLILWNFGKNSLKWFGAVIFVIGVFALLPFLLALAVTAIMGYFIYRIHRNERRQKIAIEPVTPYKRTTIDVSQDLDMLDEWERKISKEEK
ncbi:hypothetical protein M3231_06715 [Neobacillus mesonae]|nr:hypothetical protein [Neobacillus mesonae]